MRHKILQLQILFLVGIPISIFSETLSLDDCLNIGMEHNQSLRINRYDTDLNISQAKSNIGMVLPTVDFSLSSGSSSIAGASSVAGYGSSLLLTQNIWDGGVWYNTLKSVKIAQEAADTQNRSYEINTAYEVKSAFYSYLSTKKLLDVYKENLVTSNYQHQLTLERFRLGAASQNDTLRTRVTIEQAKLQIINGEVDLEKKARDLNIILGREWDSPLELKEPVWQAVEVPDMAGIESDVLGTNPQLLLLDNNRTVSGYNVKIARAGYIPSLGFSASYSNSALEMGDVFAEPTSNMSTQFTLRWNLFNGTRTSRGVQQSKISAKMAEENFVLSTRKVKKELAQILQTMTALNESVEISQLILNASEQDLLLAQEQYKIGSVSILDVLRITASYEDAKSNLIRTQYNLKIAEAGLLQLMGKQ